MSAALSVRDFIPWFCGLPPEERGRWLIMALKAFVDDSGKDHPPTYVLAGFVSRSENWDEFSGEWSSRLKMFGLPYFKMQEAFTLTGAFHGCAVVERDLILQALAHIVKRHVMAAISATVTLDDYTDIFKGQISHFLDRPYGILFYYIMYSAIEWQKDANLEEPVDFVYDEQMHDSDIINTVFSFSFKSAPPEIRNRLGSRPVFANDKTVLPIQAADMLAWHVRRYYYDRDTSDPTQTAALPILADIPHQSTRLERQHLEKMRSGLFEFIRAEGNMFPYEVKNMVENMDKILGSENIDRIKNASSGEVVDIVAIPATEMKRYLLVRNCPACDTPHLHRKSGGTCLAEATASPHLRYPDEQ